MSLSREQLKEEIKKQLFQKLLKENLENEAKLPSSETTINQNSDNIKLKEPKLTPDSSLKSAKELVSVRGKRIDTPDCLIILKPKKIPDKTPQEIEKMTEDKAKKLSDLLRKFSLNLELSSFEKDEIIKFLTVREKQISQPEEKIQQAITEEIYNVLVGK